METVDVNNDFQAVVLGQKLSVCGTGNFAPSDFHGDRTRIFFFCRRTSNGSLCKRVS